MRQRLKGKLLAKSPLKKWKTPGGKVQVSAYISTDMYSALQRFRDPDETRWESSLIRRIIREWLEMKEIVWRKNAEEKSKA